MAAPFVRSGPGTPKSGFDRLAATRRTSRQPLAPGARIHFEPLEKRFLLSADLLTSGVADALSAGVNEVGDLVKDFVETDALLDSPVPLVLRTEEIGVDDFEAVTPSVRDLLQANADIDGDGTILGIDESALSAIDLAGDGDGTVNFGEMLQSLFINPVNSAISSAASEASGAAASAALISALEGLDTDIGPISLSVDSVTDTSVEGEVSFTLDFSLTVTQDYQLDLGTEADLLGLKLPDQPFEEVVASLSLPLTIGVAPSGAVAVDGDFFMASTQIDVAVDIHNADLDTDLNVGFLGTEIVDGTIDVDMDVESAVEDPNSPVPLGFEASQFGTTATGGTLTAANAPTSVVLADDANFQLRFDAGAFVDVTVSAASTVGNTTLADLLGDIKSAIDSAAGFTTAIDVVDAGGKVSLVLGPHDPTALGFAGAELFSPGTVGAGGSLTAALASFDLASDVTFLLAVGGALPRAVTVGSGPNIDSAALTLKVNGALSAAGFGASVTATDTGTGFTLSATGAGDSLAISNDLTLESRISLADLTGNPTSALVDSDVGAGSAIDISLPLSVKSGIGLSVAGVELEEGTANPFDPALDAAGEDRIALPFDTTSLDAELLNFNSISATEMIGLFDQLAGALDNVRLSDFYSGFDIPLTGANLGEVIDFTDMLTDALLFDDGDDGIGGAGDTAKLLVLEDGDLAVSFDTAQDLADRLATVLGVSLGTIGASYDATSNELTYNIDVSHVVNSLDAPFDFEFDLDPLREVVSASLARVSATAGMAFELGLDLTPASETPIDGSTLLASLNGGTGIAIGTDLALTGLDEVRTILGRLSGDASFEVSIDGSPAVAVSVTSTGDNFTVDDLVDDINDGLAAAGLGASLEAEADGLRVNLVATDGGIAAFELTAEADNPAVRELGFAPLQEAELDDTTLTLAGGLDVPSIVGRLSADASFDVAVDTGGGPVPTGVTVTALSTAENETVLDLVFDVNAALAAAGIGSLIGADADGDRLVLKAVDGSVVGFDVTTLAGSVAETELGVATAGSANTADLVIFVQDGTAGPYLVSLDGATTLGDVILAINGATGGDVTASFNDTSTGLKLTDNTVGAELFRADSVNASPAAFQLGILGVDISGLVEGEVADGTIEGDAIGAIEANQRFFMEDAVLDVDLSVSTPSGITGEALYGFVATDIVSGVGSISADITTNFLNPGSGIAGDRITLSELFQGLDIDVTSIIEAPSVSGSGSITLDLQVQPGFASLSTGPAPQVVINLDDYGNPFAAGGPIDPVISVDTSNADLGDLTQFEDITYDSVLSTLEALTDFLDDFSANPFLSDALPLINLSVEDLLGFTEGFDAAATDAELTRTDNIQGLLASMRDAFGIPSVGPGSDAIDIVLDDGLLRFDLVLDNAFTSGLGVDIDMSDFGKPNFTGAAGLQGTGDATLDLDFGIDLANPGDASGAGDVFLFSSTAMSGNVRALGSNLTFRGQIGPAGIFVAQGDADLDADFDLTVAAGALPLGDRILLGDVDFANDFDGAFSGSVDAVLPAFFPTESNFVGEITLSGDLANPASIDLVVPNDLLTIDLSQFDLLDNVLLAADGLDIFLEDLQDQVDDEVSGLNLPISGEDLADATQFISAFRSEFIDGFREGIENAVEVDFNTVRDILFDVLHNDLGVLLNAAGTGAATSVTDIDVVGGPDFIQWDLNLGEFNQTSDANIGFDLGLPGLELSGDGGLETVVDWDLELGFGLSFQEGFYVDIADPDELEVTIDVTLENDTMAGSLGFLPVLLSDDASNPTQFHGEFTIDLVNQTNAADARLSFGELGLLALDTELDADAQANFDISSALDSGLFPGFLSFVFPALETKFSLDWDVVGDSLSDGLDAGLNLVEFEDISLDLASYLQDMLDPILGQIQQATDPIQPIIDVLTDRIPVISDLAGRKITLLDIARAFGFADVGMIDALARLSSLGNEIDSLSGSGSALLNYGGFTLFDINDPTLNQLDLTDPTLNLRNEAQSGFIMPDNPLFSLGSALSGVGDSTVSGLIDSLADGIFGSFELPLLTDSSEAFGLVLGRPSAITAFDLPAFGVNFTYSQFFPIFGPLGAQITGTVGAGVDLAFGFDTLGIAQFADGGFRNPGDIFNGFFISDTNEPDGSFGRDVPEVVLSGGLSAAAVLNLGIASGGVSGGIFADIFFDLFDPDSDGRVRLSEIAGNFENQIRFGDASLAPLAIFDVSGEVFAQLSAFLKIDLGIVTKKFTFNITPPITLVDFNLDFNRPPILATELDDGSLLLNMGPNAFKRINGNIDDGAEHFVVTDAGAGLVAVSAPSLGVGPQVYSVSNKIIALGGAEGDVIDITGVTAASIGLEAEGGAGDDTVLAGAGDAEVLGGSGDDTLVGGSGDDRLIGEKGNDVVEGGEGNDILFGDRGEISDSEISTRVRVTDGDDTLIGGSGDDILFGGGGEDLISGDIAVDPELGDDDTGDEGDDLIFGDAAKIQLIGGVIDAIFQTDRGRGASDIIFGNRGDDEIHGGRGDDIIDGGAGDDDLFGGKGFDTLSGAGGADLIFGGTESDLIYGNRADDANPAADDGDDEIFGESGNDEIHGNDGADTLFGGRGADFMFGDAGNDLMFGESDPDIMFGGADSDVMEGNASNDIIFGDDGLVAKIGSAADDAIVGKGSLGLLSGHSGDGDVRTIDLIVTDAAASDGNDTISAGSGDDIVLGGNGADVIGGDVDPNGSVAGDTPTGRDVLIGDGGVITQSGRRLANVSSQIGTSGNDRVHGDNGDDVILGGGGSDQLFGGHGASRGATDPAAGDADILIGDNGTVEFASGERTRVFSTDSSGGTGGGDTIEGNEDDDVILGGVGGDNIVGQLGDDIIVGDNGLLDFNTGDGDRSTLDLVQSTSLGLGGNDTISGNDGDDIVLGGAGSDDISGNGDDDVLLGDSGEVMLVGGAVAEIRATDTSAGTGAGDVISGNAGNDVVIGGVGGDTLQGNDGNDAILGDNARLDFDTGDGDLSSLDLIVSTELGLGGDDVISGNSGGDIVVGGAGSDQIHGGASGDDSGDQADMLVGDSGEIILVPAPAVPAGGEFVVLGGAVSQIRTIDTTAGTGAGDAIVGQLGGDVIVGGVGGDSLTGNDGNDTIVGDNGLIDFDTGDGDVSTVDRVVTTEQGLGGADTATGNIGSDLIIGGHAGDDLAGNDGEDAITGDNVEVTLSGGVIRRIESTDAMGATGGADVIDGGDDGDIMIGGSAGDIIDGGVDDDVNIVLGDNGTVVLADGSADENDLFSTFPTNSGADTITTSLGDDIIVGGGDGDTIVSSGGEDVVLGDHGRVERNGVETVQRAASLFTNIGGDDDIQSGDEGDVVIGGVGGDVIDAGVNLGANVVLGDNGEVFLNNAGANDIFSIAPTDSGADQIVTGLSNDIVIAGGDDDTIDSSAGLDIVMGDHGRIERDGAEVVHHIESLFTGNGGDDIIRSGIAGDIVIAGVGDDDVDTGSDAGDDIVLGDNGEIFLNNADDNDIISTAPADSGTDTIVTGPGDDIVMAGGLGDTVDSGSGEDIVLGDHGRIDRDGGHVVERIASLFTDNGGDDVIDSGTQADIVLGGFGADDIDTGADVADDIAFGDNGVVVRNDGSAEANDMFSIDDDDTHNGADEIVTGAGDDTVIGGGLGDTITSGAGEDVVLGDHGRIERDGNDANERIESIFEDRGDDDIIDAGSENDIILGGLASDTIEAGSGDDIALGDNGLLNYILNASVDLPLGEDAPIIVAVNDTDVSTLDLITTRNPNLGDSDLISGSAGDDIILGGTAGDDLSGGENDDLIFGDHGEIYPQLGPTRNFFSIDTGAADGGFDDLIHGDAGDDILLGQQGDDVMFGGDNDDDLIGGHNVTGGIDELDLVGAAGDDGANDIMDGGTGDDVMAGDNAQIWRQADPETSPRFQALTGSLMYNPYDPADALVDGAAAISGVAQTDPTAIPGDGTGRDVELLDHTADLEDDLGPNPWGNDTMAGGADDDVMFGGLGEDLIQGDGRIDEASLLAFDIFEAASDGDDYVEGNGGGDLIYGGLGQDDLIGGSSSLFGLETPAERPDGADTIFGGAGTRIARNIVVPDGDILISETERHALDSDMIAGDNANIYRLVTDDGSGNTIFLTFNYDDFSGSLKIVPRAIDLLDYTPGIGGTGAGDRIHAESGDDFVHGMTGDDILHGDSEGDDLFGGAGSDWMSGGTGDDGMIGDDGKVFTSRNGTAEPLYGIAATTEQFIRTPGGGLQATLNPTGELKKTVDLEPFDLGGDDMMYGGLGDDAMHGGAGHDGMSGAEALSEFYAADDFGDPAATGNITVDPVTGRIVVIERTTGGETVLADWYDQVNSLVKIEGHALNFDATEGDTVASGGAGTGDGEDVLFGDLGSDWLVGGSGRDHLYGGMGHDIHNADDDLETSGGLNDVPDQGVLDPSENADIAFGGGGIDHMIGNTGADRLNDWAGEFNNFVVPFAPFGDHTVSRKIAPFVPEFFYALSESDGADPTRADGTGGDPARNGEPFGELGLVLQQDDAWQDQTGGPSDKQAGNIGGGKKDTRGDDLPGTEDGGGSPISPADADPVAASGDSGDPEVLLFDPDSGEIVDPGTDTGGDGTLDGGAEGLPAGDDGTADGEGGTTDGSDSPPPADDGGDTDGDGSDVVTAGNSGKTPNGTPFVEEAAPPPPAAKGNGKKK